MSEQSEHLVEIRGVAYTPLSIEEMDRDTVREFRGIAKELQEGGDDADPDLLWQVAGLLFPGLPEDVLGSLTMRETLMAVRETSLFAGTYQGLELGKSLPSPTS